MAPRYANRRAPSKRMRPVGNRAVVPSPYRRSVSIPRGVRSNPTGLPNQLTVKHRFSIPTAFLQQTTAAPAVVLISCNGIFSPTSLPALKPLYFDKMSDLYDHYTVIASALTVTAHIPSAVTLQNYATVGSYIVDDTTLITNAQSAMEQPSSVHKLCTHEGGHVVVRNKWASRQFFGGNTMDNDQLRGSATTNPGEESHFAVYAYTSDASYANVFYTVDVVYTAVWTELRDIL